MYMFCSLQLDTYAKFNFYRGIQREHTFAREVCSDDLYDIYYSGNNAAFTYSIVTSTIILPLVVCVVCFIAIRNINYSTAKSLTKPSNHSSLVSLSYVGIIVSVFILLTDMIACYTVAKNDHEYHIWKSHNLP